MESTLFSTVPSSLSTPSFTSSTPNTNLSEVLAENKKLRVVIDSEEDEASIYEDNEALPEYIIPSNLSSNKYTTFIWSLTPRGVKQAKQRFGKEFHSFCVACYEERSPQKSKLKDCFFKTEVKKGGNMSNHFKNVHSTLLAGSCCLSIKRLNDPQLLGQSIGGGGGVVEFNVVTGKLEKKSYYNHSANIEIQTKVITRFGLAPNVVNDPLWRKMLHVARRTSTDEDVVVGSKSIKSSVISQFTKYLVAISEDVKSFQGKPRIFVEMDGWDHSTYRYFGSSLSYIIETSSGLLQYKLLPLGFCRLKTDITNDRIQSDAQQAKVLEKQLDRVKIRKSDLAGLKTYNAANGIIKKFMDGTPVFYGVQFKDSQDQEKGILFECVGHLINLAGTYANGIAKSKGEAIPATCSWDCEQVISIAAQQSNVLSKAKVWSTAEQLAKDQNFPIFKPVLYNDTRWWGIPMMLEKAILNHQLTAELDGCQSFDDDSLVLAREMHAIMMPTTNLALNIAQKSTAPSGYFTLPLIYLLLLRFGIRFPQGIWNPPKYDDQVKFCVLSEQQPDSKKRCYVEKKLESFSSEGKSFFETWREHLYYRLIIQRGNKFFYEIAGMFLDPAMRMFSRPICGEDFTSCLEMVKSFISKFENGNKKCNSTHLDYIAAFCGAPIIQDELDSFLGEKLHPACVNAFLQGVTLENFISLIKTYDPLLNWNGAENQQRVYYPNIFRANLVTLAYISTTGFQESSFSSSRRVLRPERNYMKEDLVEATVCNYISLSNDVRTTGSTSEKEGNLSEDLIDNLLMELGAVFDEDDEDPSYCSGDAEEKEKKKMTTF